MITIRDVAKEAGVSLGTVSNVLNHRTSVKKENCDKVMAAVEKLKFQFNTVSKQLNSSFLNSIGLIIPNIMNPFYPEIVKGVEDAALTAKYNVFVCNNDRLEHKETEYLDLLCKKRVDGILLYKPMVSIKALEEISKVTAVTLVDASEKMKGLFNSVNIDDCGGTLDAMNFIYDNGHRRIAYISGLFEAESSIKRLNVYKDFLVSKGMGVEETLIKKGNYDWYSGYTSASALLRLMNPPTAIFAATDLMAIGAIKAVLERGLRVPEDVSIMGHDDVFISEIYSPRLTTVRQPKYEIGVASVELLIRHIEGLRTGHRLPVENIQLRNELVIRDSVIPIGIKNQTSKMINVDL